MIYALADFGSTFTKVALVDGGSGSLLATSQHPTTVASDVLEGFRAALAEALRSAGRAGVDRVLAASSAAGGLRMVAVGLVDDLTASAARRAALSAGAKVEAVWSGRLGEDEVAHIRRAAPDVILFAGGTDGGEREQVLRNAESVAAAGTGAAVVVACNRDIGDDAGRVFERSGHHVVVVDNVLPRIDVERTAPAQRAIRELFVARVVRAKGLSATSEFFDSVLMPTPAAVLRCAELIGDPPRDGLAPGSTVVVDVGGATTDVHSVLPPSAPARRVRRLGPPPAPSARTVEGDLGVRWNADTVYAQDDKWMNTFLGVEPDRVRREVDRRKAEPAFVPTTAEQSRIDRALAISCITTGLERHVGRLSTHYVPGEGAEAVLTGRDLRDTRVVVVTGGSVVRDHGAGADLVETALERMDASRPAPRGAALLVDQSYLLAAAGLLAEEDPPAALRLLTAQIPGLGEALSARARHS